MTSPDGGIEARTPARDGAAGHAAAQLAARAGGDDHPASRPAEGGDDLPASRPAAGPAHDARRPRLVVDGSNVMGARPDGWWRDRTAARVRLTVEIDAAAVALTAALLGDRSAEVVVVHDGRPVEMQLLRVFARFAGHADDLVADLSGPGDVVVASDRELVRRVEARGARAVGARRVLDLL